MRRLIILGLWAGLALPAAPVGLRAEPDTAKLAKMFAVPGLPDDPARIDWTALPKLPSRRFEIYHGEKGITGYNHHPSIIHFGGRFFVLWNSGYRDEDASGQKAVYATSPDGEHWSAPQELSGRQEGRRFTIVGLWNRDNELYALVALRDSSDALGRAKQSKENPLFAFHWSAAAAAFEPPIPMVMNFFSNNIPQKTPDGQWLMLGKGVGEEAHIMRVARGGADELRHWVIADLPPGPKMEEPEWYTLPDGALVADCRCFLNPKTGGGRMIRLLSRDSGKTWSDRVVTDFPEAESRNDGFRLRSGSYALLVNPNPFGERIPLSLALSDDGLVFTRLANLRDEPTQGRYPGRAKGYGYSYVRGMEYAGSFYAIYSVNKEDIEVSVVPLSAIDEWRTRPN